MFRNERIKKSLTKKQAWLTEACESNVRACERVKKVLRRVTHAQGVCLGRFAKGLNYYISVKLLILGTNVSQRPYAGYGCMITSNVLDGQSKRMLNGSITMVNKRPAACSLYSGRSNQFFVVSQWNQFTDQVNQGQIHTHPLYPSRYSFMVSPAYLQFSFCPLPSIKENDKRTTY